MNKIIFAVAILSLTTAFSTSAANLIEKDGFTYEMDGDIQIQLQKDNGKDKHLYVNYDSLEFDNKVLYKLNDDLTAYGRVKFDFSDAANGDEEQNSAEIKDAMVGFKYINTSLSVGKQDYATDEFGIAEDYEMDSEDVAFDETDGNNVILVNIDLGSVEILLSTDLQAEGEDNEGEQSYDAFVSYDIADLELAAAYQNREAEVDGDTINSYGVSASYDAGFAVFAADYSESQDIMKVYNFVTMFNITDDTEIVLGYVKNKFESDDDVNEWYTNVTYELPQFNSVKLFAEVSNTDADDAEMAYVLGTELEF